MKHLYFKNKFYFLCSYQIRYDCNLIVFLKLQLHIIFLYINLKTQSNNTFKFNVYQIKISLFRYSKTHLIYRFNLNLRGRFSTLLRLHINGNICIFASQVSDSLALISDTWLAKMEYLLFWGFIEYTCTRLYDFTLLIYT